MGDISVEMTVVGRCLVAKVNGVLDYVTQPAIRSRFRDLITHGNPYIVLDLSGVSFCDSAGLNTLLAARRQAAAVGGLLVLACVPVALRRILEMTGVDQVLQVYDAVDAAAAALGG